MADSIQFSTMTDERAQRVVASEAAHMSSWMESMQEQFGPSFGIHIARFGNAVAFVAQGLHDNSIFNRVIGLCRFAIIHGHLIEILFLSM